MLTIFLQKQIVMKKLLVLCLGLIMATGLMNAQSYPTAAADVSPLLTGETIEDTPLFKADGQEVSLYSLQDKPTVMVFYRGIWCSNCVKHFNQEFKDNLQAIEAMGYRLMLISCDQGESLKGIAEQTGVPVSYFYGDKNNALSKKMGLAWAQQDRLKERLMQSSENTNTDALLPVTAMYIVNTAHEIRFADIRPLAIPVAKRIPAKEFMPILKVYAE